MSFELILRKFWISNKKDWNNNEEIFGDFDQILEDGRYVFHTSAQLSAIEVLGVDP